ncbi:hypothetical protein [Polaromonas sp.]|uniref:hypothetical protein n=1 Tax=Polaromonas sp. TaxID=1869339 RepID=UPI0035669582
MPWQTARDIYFLAAQQADLAAAQPFLAAQQPFLAVFFFAAQQPFLAPQQPFLPAQADLGAPDAAAHWAKAGAADTAAAATKDAPTMFFREVDKELDFIGISGDEKAPVAWQKVLMFKRYDTNSPGNGEKLQFGKRSRFGCSCGLRGF